MKTKILSVLLCLSLLLTIVPGLLLPAFAEDSESQEKIPVKALYISNSDRFLQFAENCRMDDYSRNLTVYLTTDIDLTGIAFQGIPLFLGTFEGNHHKITGLDLRCDGSNLGLFRFLGEGSTVRELTVSGTVAPEGSRLNVGGIVGTNRGTVESCRFDGSVSGADRIGGIAGSNQLTGVIESCQAIGSLSADHFAGGIAGENIGVIRNCINRASVNTQARESTVNVKSISLETITGTESPGTVTDIGGIAGSSTGVIRDCISRGPIGYPHMGYNIGGIAGSHRGYIENCQNYGEVRGRKEVGGIAGQCEPVSIIQFQMDTLQILEEQLAGASSLLNRAAYNAQSNMGAVSQGIQNMQQDAEDAKEALEQLKPDGHIDPDGFIAAGNALKDSLHSMHDTMNGIGNSIGSAAGQLSQDLRAVSGQMSAMGKTIKEANEHMGIRLTDVSDQDIDEDYGGKIENCQNFGAVSGDLNAGGITGSIAYENDLDPEDDLKTLGDRSLNFEGSLRSVILHCENRGTITAKKLQVGGIVGYMSMGLVKDCVNTGSILAEKAQYAGGIAGSSRGYIRSCSVKCELSGGSIVGGIAGSGTIATDCLSMVNILKGSEKLGAILGIQEPCQDEEIQEPIKNNLYMNLARDPGAIDGISYSGKAEPVAPHRFKTLPNLPRTFQTTTLIFKDEKGDQKARIVLPLGDLFRLEDIPQVPQKDGCTAVWKDMETYGGQRVYFDKIFTPEYTPHRMTIASPLKRDNGRPVLLAEGIFPEASEIQMEPMALPELDGEKVLEAWKIPMFSLDSSTDLHFNQPENTDITHLKVFVLTKDSAWEERESTVNARHLVFSVNPGDQGFCVSQVPDYRKPILVFGSIAAASLLLALSGFRRSSKKKKAAK